MNKARLVKGNNPHLNPEPILPNPKSQHGDAPQTLVDWCSLKVVAGRGGHGVIRFTSIFMKEFAGPDGGDGGNGGHVVLRAKDGVSHLGHLPTELKGNVGENGAKCNMTGKCAEHVFIDVPLGTMIKQPETNELLADLATDGQMYVAARGGVGGKGNASFLTNENRAPEYAEEGAPGEERKLWLEMRTIAEAGFVGFPNAGKSTLLRAISRARPKVAAYPFTTLRPHVGFVNFTDLTTLTVADIPGIVVGAHKGHGLGLEFLRHIQRCKCLLYVIDLSEDDAVGQLEVLKFELEQFEEGLSRRPAAILGNKIDLTQSKLNFLKLKKHLEEIGDKTPLFAVSGRDAINIKDILLRIKDIVKIR